MKTRRALPSTLVLLLLAGNACAQPLGTAFTYQGQLTESGEAASGLFDLQVCLFDSAANQTPIACAPDFDDVPVDAGVFALALDFGTAPFSGQQRYLELRVRAGASSGAYTILAPRQLVRATPEALRAGVASAAPWSGLSGVPAGFADGVDDDSGGTVTSIRAGVGLSGGTITGSGTIAIANGGVGPAQLATGAVGLSQINNAQVQARITGTCAIGEYFRGINPDGSVACESVQAFLGINLFSTVDDSANVVGLFSSLAIGTDGLPVISYRDVTARALKVAKCANTACTGMATVTTVDDPANDVGFDTSIAVNGLPVISYFDLTAGALKVARCNNAACTGVATITTVDNPANDVGSHTSIAIGADSLPVISYRDLTAGALKVAKCNNPACTAVATITTVDDPANNVGTDTSIAIGADSLPVVSYRDLTAGALKVAKCNNPACTGVATITTVDDPANNVGFDTGIAIGADDLPVISYRDQTAGALKVAKCANAACTGAATITTVDGSANIVGRDTSIAIGADGLPVISYRDNQTGAFKVAQCNNPACTGVATITTIGAPLNSAGADTSIAIGTDALPVISYLEADALKVVKCGTRNCRQ